MAMTYQEKLERNKMRRRTIPEVYFKARYRGMKSSSKKRGHPEPNFTFEAFIEWLKKQPNLTQLWQDYQNSNHDRDFAPSCDRLDDSLPYSLGNIRLTTWKENNLKAQADNKAGKISAGIPKRPVIAQFPDGSTQEYISAAEAGRMTGTEKNNIGRACRTGIRANGIHWSYKENLSPTKD